MTSERVPVRHRCVGHRHPSRVLGHRLWVPGDTYGLRRPIGTLELPSTGWVQATINTAGTCVVPFAVAEPTLRCRDCPQWLDISPLALSAEVIEHTLWLPALHRWNGAGWWRAHT